MKAFLILTALRILGLIVVALTMDKMDPAGISVVIGWGYVIVAYVFSLVTYGFWRAYLRFQDSRREVPQLDHSGHRHGLVGPSQLPEFMKTGDPSRDKKA